MKEQTIEEFID